MGCTPHEGVLPGVHQALLHTPDHLEEDSSSDWGDKAPDAVGRDHRGHIPVESNSMELELRCQSFRSTRTNRSRLTAGMGDCGLRILRLLHVSYVHVEAGRFKGLGGRRHGNE